MRKFNELIKEQAETVVFTFGRFNPPTTGHEKLIKKVASVAGSNPFRIYPSHTTNPKKDPLPHALKVAYMRKMFKKYGNSIVADKTAKTAIDIAVKLYDDGFKNITMVVGSDRVQEFKKLLNEYNGVEGKRHGFYKFDSISVVSAGERDPDAEDVSGMSASKMRAAAADGDKDAFMTGLPSGFRDGVKLYRDVRKHMGIREERDMGDMTDFETVRDMYLTGKIWNAGDIVEAKGVTGEVVREGTNYLSFVDESGKVHKAWMHEIELDEGKAPDVTKGDVIIVSKSKRPYKMGGMVDPKTTLPAESDKMVVKKVTKSKDGRKAHLTHHDPKKRGGYAIYLDKMPDFMSVKIAENVELDEAWFNKVMDKIDQVRHPKNYENMVKQFVQVVKDKSGTQTRDGGTIKIDSPTSIAVQVAQSTGAPPRGFISYINKLVDKGVLPKELKAQVQKEMVTFKDLVNQINEVKQDPDIKGSKGTEPAKYYAKDAEGDEMSVSTKKKRDAHFAKKKKGPAPGDATAKTKPSQHSRKFKQMYGEALPKNADQGDYIDDFEKSDAPQFKGKSKEKRKDMAIAAYLSKNESFLDNVNKMLSEDGHTDVTSMKNKIQIAMSALQKMQSELTKLGDEDDLPTWWTNKVATAVSRIDDMSDYLDTQVESYQLDEKIAALVKKADKSGMPYSILKKVYDRGMAAYKTGHRPGTTPQQWALARVNSFTTKSSGTWGKADKDLAKQVEMVERLEEDGPCWDTHKQVGMKKKGGKMVPDCVPKNEDLNEWGEVEEAAEYQGRKVTLNKPTKGDIKKSKVYVRNEKGNVVKVEFGDPNMQIQKDIPARRKSFRARHNCDNPGPKWKARYWSCKAW